MFFVFNKDKITAYVITVFTVIILFLTASIFNNEEQSVQTSVNESKAIITNAIIDNKNEEENIIKNIK